MSDLTRGGLRKISIIVTTYGSDTYYTQACLEAMRRWKRPHHELIVVTHDETALLRAYLEACRTEGLIDKLILAASGHGHTRGFNLGLRHATADVVFNVANDIRIGPSLVDDCADKLRADLRLGIMGWHWHSEGTFWRGGKLETRPTGWEARPPLPPSEERNIRLAPWFTRRTFEALRGPRSLCLCNTSFFGARREVLDLVGGGFSKTYAHYWADDFLCYAVLDQGFDVSHFEVKFRQKAFFNEFQYDNVDVPDRHRHDDALNYDGAFLDSIGLLGGGMSQRESVFLHLLGKALPDRAAVTNVGVWRGSSAIVLLDALRDKRADFHFIDCFDLSGISAMSAQPPVGREEFYRYIEPYIMPGHTVHILRANTLEMDRFPPSDFVFLDGGHTAECISHDARLVKSCLRPGGIAAFHDYGCSSWPAVKPHIDGLFEKILAHETLAVHRCGESPREEFAWPTDSLPNEGNVN